MQGTYAVIYLSNFRHNLDVIRKLHPIDTAICLAVKADAYGHGAIELAREAINWGVQYLGVARISEARILRNAGIQAPILLFSLPLPDEIDEALDLELELFIGDEELMDLIRDRYHGVSEQKPIRPVGIHLKIDTGMGRIGCKPEDAMKLAQKVQGSPELCLKGIATHLPVADGASAAEREFTRKQLTGFQTLVTDLTKAGIKPGLIHSLNSAGILDYPEFRFNMIRPGIMAYGYAPAQHQNRLAELRPVMELRSTIAFIKEVPAGMGLSYGHTHRTKGSRRIATLAIGYADGLSRSLSNRILITTSQGPVAQVGTICMDQCLADLGPIHPGKSDSPKTITRFQEVVIFGPNAAESAQSLAEKAGTISYEITCGISKRVPRVYLK